MKWNKKNLFEEIGKIKYPYYYRRGFLHFIINIIEMLI